MQKPKQDIYKANQTIDNVISELIGFRDNADKEFEHWFNLAARLGEEVSTVPAVPRLAKSWSRFKPNVENDGPLSHCKSSLAILFLDDINSQLKYHLEDRNHTEIFAMLPSVMFERDYNLEITVKILLEKYHNEVTNDGVHFRSN